ncbi:MAG: glycosyltransferase family 4 protein [Fibrobacter sp.]|nr:glycosyltransferase family 4 protein [Fibrobacter sp.]
MILYLIFPKKYYSASEKDRLPDVIRQQLTIGVAVMQILFFGVFCRKEEEAHLIKNSNIGVQGAVISFQWNLIEGLIANLEAPISILNFLPVGTYPKYYKKIILKSVEWRKSKYVTDKTIGFINLLGIKQIIQIYRAKIEIENWLNKTDDKDKCILIYDLVLPYLIALNWVKKKYPKIITCSIVADLPNQFGYNKKDKGLMKLLRRFIGKVQLHEIQKMNCYALLTKHMKYPLNIPDASYVVIEGIASSNVPFREIQRNSKNIIMYAGVLTDIYGIDNLVKAFMGIDDTNYELWLCGSGDYEDTICKCLSVDKRIKYFGYCPKNKIYELQSQASVLVNPRQNIGEYTKYSFPSKIMEYLAAGRPVIAYRLDGIPLEYYDYIQCVDGNAVRDLREKMIEVCELSFEERQRLGAQGRQFVMQNKNARTQCKKILDLLSSVFENHSTA